MSITINGKTMTAETIATGTHAAADLAARGMEPTFYSLTGKRGACYMAMRCATTGRFIITAKV